MAWIPTGNMQLGLQKITENSTVQKHALGLIIQARDPDYGVGEFIYLKGVASTAIRNWVSYNYDDWSTTRLVANAIGPVAIAMSACVASEYGWYQISGKAIGSCKTSFADNGRVFMTSTDGSVDDASVAGDGVNNARGASTTTANTFVADFEISRPWVDDKTNFSP